MVRSKYIKCDYCMGKGCSICDFSGLVNYKSGNKEVIDNFYDNLSSKRRRRR